MPKLCYSPVQKCTLEPYIYIYIYTQGGGGETELVVFNKYCSVQNTTIQATNRHF